MLGPVILDFLSTESAAPASPMWVFDVEQSLIDQTQPGDSTAAFQEGNASACELPDGPQLT